MQNFNEKILEEEGLQEECDEDPFCNMYFSCMHSPF